MNDEMKIDTFLPEGFLETGVVTGDRMRIIDRNAQAYGISSLQLMESAGLCLANVIRRYTGGRVLFLCGSGNNGGDGMVAARHLQKERTVTVCYYNSPHMTTETRSQLLLLQACRVHLQPFICRDDINGFADIFLNGDLIVDALLGTGTEGTIHEPILGCVKYANESNLPIISADIPTPGIKSSLICAFHRPKIPGSEVHDIGIPYLADICTGPGDLLLIRKREKTAHKGVGGNILIIGGGPYQGAPYLAGLGALRAGADVVKVASTVSMPIPDLIHIPLKGEKIGIEHAEILAKHCKEADVVICGMGLGPGSHDLVREIAPLCKKAVFDADALRLPLPVAGETLYTPHAGEFTRITGEIPGFDPTGRVEIVRAANLPGVVLLKGAIDLISDGHRIRFNNTGTPAMTTGGTGDILAGVCGALMVNLTAFDAACIGAYVTGRAGERLAETMGYGMTAQDLLRVIPEILYRKDN